MPSDKRLYASYWLENIVSPPLDAITVGIATDTVGGTVMCDQSVCHPSAGAFALPKLGTTAMSGKPSTVFLR